MSNKIDQFCDAMRTNLNNIEAQIDEAKSEIAKAQKDGADLFDRRIADARTAVASQRSQVEAAGIKVRHWVVAQAEAGEAVIQGWRDSLDRSKLELHADRAEASARASVVLAKAALADAKLAAYEAMAARHHAAEDAK